ncbi:MAG: DUF4395 domain-containing protein [Deltaproteobacteria bacterium]|nr:DUF4395 domain-containing protein [Deltaproteobacteria bacterium]
MDRFIQFGEQVEGYPIPVLNEREIRAAAGILFVLMFVAILLVILQGNFLLLKFAATIFLVDIVIRAFVNPRFSPFLILGRWIVRNQVPEYVGAPQKRFAWFIGTGLATVMFGLQVLANTYGPITGIICLICLVFLFFESAFGICLGCKVYPLFHRGPVQHCPGEVCTPAERREIQRVSRPQFLVVLGFAALVVVGVRALGDSYREPPRPLFAPPAETRPHG